jgi:hypothetical protein
VVIKTPFAGVEKNGKIPCCVKIFYHFCGFRDFRVFRGQTVFGFLGVEVYPGVGTSLREY